MANISFLLNQFPAGGVERVTMNLVPHLVDKGHSVFIFVNKLNKQHILHINSLVTYITIPYEAWDNKNEDVVINAVKEYGIEVFFSPIISPEYVYNLKSLNICKVCYALHGVPFYELKEMLYCDRLRIKHYRNPFRSIFLYVAHKFNSIFDSYRRQMVSIYRRRYDKLDAFGVLFDYYGETIAKSIGVDYPNSKIVTLQNPFPCTTDTISHTQRKKQIVYVGRLSYVDKRLDRLLEVWNAVYKGFPEWKLVIVGGGPEKENLQRYVNENNLARVEFVPFTPTPEIFYKESEIFCLTSDFEGFGMVLLEAQQCGCATIAFNCSYGIQDILSPNWENGVFVPNGDIDAYAEALSRLMSDEELRRKIQNNGPASVKRFPIEKSVEQYDSLIKKLCNE